MVKILNITLKKKKYIVETSIGEYKLNEEVLKEKSLKMKCLLR